LNRVNFSKKNPTKTPRRQDCSEASPARAAPFLRRRVAVAWRAVQGDRKLKRGEMSETKDGGVIKDFKRYREKEEKGGSRPKEHFTVREPLLESLPARLPFSRGRVSLQGGSKRPLRDEGVRPD